MRSRTATSPSSASTPSTRVRTRKHDYLDVRRFDADGQPLAGGGVTTVKIGFEGANATGGVALSSLEILGVAAASDGGLILLGLRRQSSTLLDTTPISAVSYREYQLLRVTDMLRNPRNLDNALQISKDAYVFSSSDAKLAVTGDGRRAYVVANNRVASFDTTTLKPFNDYNGSTGAAQFTGRSHADIAVAGVSGLLVGTGPRLAKFAGVSDGFPVPSGSITLLADRTLVVQGTARDDVVSFSPLSNKRVRVTLNGQSSVFARSAIGGIVVRTVKGNDRIDASAVYSGYFFQPGAGNDRIIGSTGNDTLDGGDGKDLFDAGSGDDLAIGTGDDDTVKGASRWDALFSGEETPLFA